MPREPVESTDSITFRLGREQARRLKERARQNHRSLSGELAFIIEQALDSAASQAAA